VVNPIHTVCVVIPVYQTFLNPAQQVSLERCLSILGSHPVVVVKPEGLDLSILLQQHPQLESESFADPYFDGINGYNRLMLSDQFYARFAQYQYMLVYQLDAFVFSDQLLMWCNQGYDYIGAPWLPRTTPPDLFERGRAVVRRKLYRWFNRKDLTGKNAHHAQYDYCAGNGGFSLRRISAMRNALRSLSKHVEPYRLRSHHTYNEDVFFCVEANRFRQLVRLPRLNIAIKFSWESNPAVAAQLNHGELPFGCHAWDKLYRTHWQPIFDRLGYSLDTLLGDKQMGNPSAKDE
jgi:hypothetical protein